MAKGKKGKLDTIFSRYIRLKHSDEEGNLICISCGKVKPIKEMQNGHFVSRDHTSGRFNEENCRPQCAGCNVFKNGNYTEYTMALVEEIGVEAVNKLLQLKQKKLKISDSEYDKMIKHYSQKVKDLQRELGIDIWS